MADMVQRIKAALLNKPQGQLTVDDVAAAVTAQVEQAITMDEETAGAFQNFVKQVFEQAGK